MSCKVKAVWARTVMVVNGGGGGGGVETQSPPNGFACLGGRNTWKLVTWKTLLLHQR